jgi:hypothetical protein
MPTAQLLGIIPIPLHYAFDFEGGINLGGNDDYMFGPWTIDSNGNDVGARLFGLDPVKGASPIAGPQSPAVQTPAFWTFGDASAISADSAAFGNVPFTTTIANGATLVSTDQSVLFEPPSGYLYNSIFSLTYPNTSYQCWGNGLPDNPVPSPYHLSNGNDDLILQSIWTGQGIYGGAILPTYGGFLIAAGLTQQFFVLPDWSSYYRAELAMTDARSHAMITWMGANVLNMQYTNTPVSGLILGRSGWWYSLNAINGPFPPMMLFSGPRVWMPPALAGIPQRANPLQASAGQQASVGRGLRLGGARFGVINNIVNNAGAMICTACYPTAQGTR